MATATAPPPSYDALPTYEDYTKDVERLKKKAETDPAFKQKINESFIKEAGSEENLKRIREGVDEFTGNITKMNAAFDDIRSRLYEVDLKELKDSKGNTYKGEAEWKGLRDQWRSLLKESQDTALKSVARCDEFQLFCDGIMKIKSLDDPRYKDTITELENFMKAPDPSGRQYNPSDIQQKGTAHSQAFQKLKDELGNFKTRFDEFAKFQKSEIGKEIDDLNAEIAKIEGEIDHDTAMITALGGALGVTVFTTLAGGVIAAAMGPLSAVAIITLVIGAAIAVGEAGTLIWFIQDWYKKTGERDRLKDEVKDKEALKATLVAIMSKLANETNGLGFILAQVDLLQNVWLTINNEAKLIGEMLQTAKDMQTLTYFQDQIVSANKAYSELSASLAKYSHAG